MKNLFLVLFLVGCLNIRPGKVVTDCLPTYEAAKIDLHEKAKEWCEDKDYEYMTNFKLGTMVCAQKGEKIARYATFTCRDWD